MSTSRMVCIHRDTGSPRDRNRLYTGGRMYWLVVYVAAMRRYARCPSSASVSVSASSCCHRCARVRNFCPASVSVMRRWPLPRTNSGVPTRSSSARMRMDRVGWVMNSDSAAAVMVPWCTTAQKVSMSRFVMAASICKI